MTDKGTKKQKPPTGAKHSLVALRDFVIVHNDYRRDIKAGQDLSDVPPLFHENLKTEKVI